MNILDIVEVLIGISLLGLGIYFFKYAYKTQNWKAYEIVTTLRRFIVGFFSTLLGLLILLGYADLF